MTASPKETCWTLLRAASGGDAAARSVFARTYADPIRHYLLHRWRGSPHAAETEDARQDIFVECMKPGGVLDRVDPERGDFRALLYGVARNIARRYEARGFRRGGAGAESVHLDDLPHQAEALSRVFDRAWARSLVREAGHRHALAARKKDAAFRERYRILRLRHSRHLPMAEVAHILDLPLDDSLHNSYRRARREYSAFLREVVAQHTGARGARVDDECRRLIAMLRA